MMAGLGHNNGPTLESGQTWRTIAWRKARTELLPKLPLEVIRIRVKRAQALGLPYKTYAGIRASTGHDLVGFLFSSNALGVYRPGQAAPVLVTQKLVALRACQQLGLAHRRIDLSQITSLDHIAEAPDPHGSWSATRTCMKDIIRVTGQPADRFVVIGDTMFERDWAEAGQMAGYLSAAAYFVPAM